MTITILPESSYLTSHEIINGGAMGVTRKASIEWDDGSLRKCYVKVYPTLDRVRKIGNELTGFIMAKALGLLQPDSAAIIPLNPMFYNDYMPAIDITSADTVWAWITTECGSSVAGNFHLTNARELMEIDPVGTMEKFVRAFTYICDQKNLPNLIAFDDFIANDDRNIGNLVMVGNGDLGIIDHGEILGRIDWISHLNTLDKNQAFNNVLLSILDRLPIDPKQAKFTTKNQAVVASDQHKDAFISIQGILLTWWKNILEISHIPISEHQKYIDTLHEFLHYRSHQPSVYFANRIGLVA